MHARSLPPVGPLLAVLVSLASFGCDSRLEPTTRPEIASAAQPEVAGPTAFSGTSQPGFYPLAVGNRWVYAHEFVGRLIPTSGEPPAPQRIYETVERQIVRQVVINGRRYLEEQAITTTENGTFGSAAYYRQDASGLYEWSPPIRKASDRARTLREALERVEPAGGSTSEREALRRAASLLAERVAAVRGALGHGPLAHAALPGTTAPDELTLLRYPLAFKSRWTVRDLLPFHVEAEVIGADGLDLPPGTLRGFRIRLDSGAVGPGDFVHVWYGTSGFLQMVGHYQLDAYDQNGQYVGRYLLDERESLTEISLAGASSIVPLPPWVARPLK